MSNSPLVSCTKISPNKNSPRNHAIDRISIHCVVGQCTAERIGEIFAPSSRQASSNYGIGLDGRIGMYVEEKDRSWCTSSRANDHRAITIEVASDTTHPYAVKDAAFSALLDLCTDICKRNGKTKVYAALIDLCVDICKRYGKTKLLWFADKDKTLAYTPKADEMVLTVHRWFAAKACPGDYLYNRHGEIAATVTARLNGGTAGQTTPTKPVTPSSSAVSPYLVRVKIDDLYIRTEASKESKDKGFIKPGVYTIVAEAAGPGATKWGKLKSGAGWISLDYVTKL